MNKKIAKQLLRIYLVPVIATVIALIFWWYYRDGGYLWWVGLIIFILGINLWGYMSRED